MSLSNAPSPIPSNLRPNRFRAAHSSFRLRMLHEQHAPTIQEPTNSAQSGVVGGTRTEARVANMQTVPPPLDLSRVIAGSTRRRMHGSGSEKPPLTSSTNLSVDTVVDALLKKQQIFRTGSIESRCGSLKHSSLKYRAGSTIEESPTGMIQTAVSHTDKESTANDSPVASSSSAGFFRDSPIGSMHHHHHQQHHHFSATEAIGGVSTPLATGVASTSTGGGGTQAPISFGVFSALHHSASGPTSAEFIHARVSPRQSAHSTCSALSFAGGGGAITQKKLSGGAINCTATSPGNSAGVVPPTPSNSNISFPFYPKSKFKMAHESFRIRMFQEQYGFEPVFMTKKRVADSKSSEFKGGDLNKYTARSYTIKNGNEIFGVSPTALTIWQP